METDWPQWKNGYHRSDYIQSDIIRTPSSPPPPPPPPPLPPKPPAQYVRNTTPALSEFRSLSNGNEKQQQHPLGPRMPSQKGHSSSNANANTNTSNANSGARTQSHSNNTNPSYNYNSYNNASYNYTSSYSYDDDEALMSSVSPSTHRTASSHTAYSGRSMLTPTSTKGDVVWDIDRPVEMPSVPSGYSDDEDEDVGQDHTSYLDYDVEAIKYSIGPQPLPPLPRKPSRHYVHPASAGGGGPPLPAPPIPPRQRLLSIPALSASPNSPPLAPPSSSSSVMPLPPRQSTYAYSSPHDSCETQTPVFHDSPSPAASPFQLSPAHSLPPVPPDHVEQQQEQSPVPPVPPSHLDSCPSFTSMPGDSSPVLPSMFRSPYTVSNIPLSGGNANANRPILRMPIPPQPHGIPPILQPVANINKRYSLPGHQMRMNVVRRQSDELLKSSQQEELYQQQGRPKGNVNSAVNSRDFGDSIARFRDSVDEPISHSLMNRLGLPSIPDTFVFDPTKLSSRDYEKCNEIWSLSGVAEWLAAIFNLKGRSETGLGSVPRSPSQSQSLQSSLLSSALASASSLTASPTSTTSTSLPIPLKHIAQCVVGLFTHHVPTLNWIQTEQVAGDVMKSLMRSGFLELVVESREQSPTDNGRSDRAITDSAETVVEIADNEKNEKESAIPSVMLSQDSSEKVVINSHVSVSGVFPLVTGGGCYTGCHREDDIPRLKLRCYASRCSRTLPVRATLPPVDIDKLSLSNRTSSNSDWGAFWKIPIEDLKKLDKRETRRQYAIHELIVGEESYVSDLNVLLAVYGGSMSREAQPKIMNEQEKFWNHAFGSIKPLIDCHSRYLMRGFKQRQQQQGPFVEGIGDIVLEWIKYAKEPYVSYANSYVWADRRLRREKEANGSFALWLERTSKDPRVKGYPYGFYFHRAIPRLARYGLLLRTIQNATLKSRPEYELLERCIMECDAIATECNKRVAAVQKDMEMLNLTEQIQFKGPDQLTDLKLKDPRRKIIHSGDVIRRGDFRLDWVETTLILLDNFLILSKPRKGGGAKYYVTKRPIPLDLLVLESVDEDAVTKSSSSKFGVGTFTTQVENKRSSKQFLMVSPSSPSKDTGHAASPTTPSSSTMAASSLSAGNSAAHINGVGNGGADDRELMYPFRITHLGQAGAAYTLYAASSAEREKWRDCIIEAKRNYHSSAHAINSEPFRLKIISDVAFGYDMPVKLPVYVPATALDRAISQQGTVTKMRPLIKSKVNCGVSFTFADGHEYCMVGLDFGVYIHDGQPGSVWKRCLDLAKVTQMDIIEGMNVILIISDRALLYYHLDAVISYAARGGPGVVASSPNGGGGAAASNSGSVGTGGVTRMPTGYRISQHKRVGFFVIGQIKMRTVVFYKRNDGLSSTFKVLEPIREKGSQRRRSKMTFSRGAGICSTEYFRETEKFYLPSEVYGLSLFKSTFAAHSVKGFELLSLDFKTPQSLPVAGSLTSSNVMPVLKKSNISRPPTLEGFKRRLESAKPVGMYRISAEVLLLCYDDLAIYCDNHGNFTGPTVIWFLCRAKTIAVQSPYVIAFDEEMIEIRRVDNGQLKQIISGKDIRSIDTKEGQIKFVMAHPKLAGRQIVLELVGNEFVVDDDGSSLSGL